MNTDTHTHSHIYVYFWSTVSYNTNAPFNYLCWECQRNLPFIYTVKSAADVCVLFPLFFLSFSVGTSDISSFFSPLVQWGHLKSVGKQPAAPSLVLSAGAGIPHHTQRIVLSSPKARAWQIKISNTRNWGEKTFPSLHRSRRAPPVKDASQLRPHSSLHLWVCAQGAEYHGEGALRGFPEKPSIILACMNKMKYRNSSISFPSPFIWAHKTQEATSAFHFSEEGEYGASVWAGLWQNLLPWWALPRPSLWLACISLVWWFGLSPLKPSSASAFSIRQVTQPKSEMPIWFSKALSIFSWFSPPPISCFFSWVNFRGAGTPGSPSSIHMIASRNQDKYSTIPFGRWRQSLCALPGRQSSRLSSPRKQPNAAARKCTSDSFGRRLMFPNITRDA